jgi:hypothetical protein
MARISQPKELAELKGADKKNPQRYIKETPKNEMGLGEPPMHMLEDARKIWHEIEAHALPGVLTASERFFMEIASNLLAEYRMRPTFFEMGKLAQLIGIFARLGLSPADRQKLGVTKKSKEDNEFNDF